MEKKKLNKELIKGLESGKTEIELQALETIRKEGFADYLPIIADLYVRTNTIEIKDEIAAIFQDIKDTNGAPIMIELLNSSSSKELKSMLLTACWSSSLDFSGYLEHFINIALEGEYMLIFEVITVIENFEYSPSSDILLEAQKRIETAILEKKDVEGEMLEQLKIVLQSF